MWGAEAGGSGLAMRRQPGGIPKKGNPGLSVLGGSSVEKETPELSRYEGPGLDRKGAIVLLEEPVLKRRNVQVPKPERLDPEKGNPEELQLGGSRNLEESSN